MIAFIVCIFSVLVQADGLNLYVPGEYFLYSGAVTSLLLDGNALYYNPANLALHRKRIDLNVLDIAVLFSQDLLVETSAAKGFVSSTQKIDTVIAAIQGKDLFMRSQALVRISLPRFAISYMGDATAAAYLQNKVYPSGNFMAHITHGLQFGYGYSLFKFQKSRGIFNIGAAAKILWRAGVMRELKGVSLLTLDTSALQTTLPAFNEAVGIDLGMQTVYQLNRLIKVFFASALLDIGDTTFSATSFAQKQQWNIGTGLLYESNAFKFSWAFDYKRIFEAMDWHKKVYSSLRLHFPFLTLYTGLYQMYPSYGFEIKFWFLRAAFMRVQEEYGTALSRIGKMRNMLDVQLGFSL